MGELKKTFLLLAAAVSISLVLMPETDVFLGFRSYLNNLANQYEGKTLNKKFQTRIKSGNLSTDYNIDQVLEDMEVLNLNTLNVPVAVNIEDLSSSTMELDNKSILKAKELIKRLKGKKINILLEPYPWISHGEYYETDWKPRDVSVFFNSWKKDVLMPLIKEVAIPCRVDAICIASNYVHLEKYQDEWCDIVDFTRKYYKGLITYKINWWYTAGWAPDTLEIYNRKLMNRVFSRVDFISIAAYFELSDKPENTVERLKSALYSTPMMKRQQNIVDEVESFNRRWSKKIFFGELGFPRRNYAAAGPWNPSPSNIENGAEQARCFAAYRDVFNQDWFLGFSVFAIGERSEDKHYYPSDQSKKVIREWFSE